MAKKMPAEKGHGRLNEAITNLNQSQANLNQALAAMAQAQASLTQTQATFTQNQAAFLSRMAKIERATSERFARIEQDMTAIMRVLAEHSRLLERLPEAVRDKIGFKG